MPTQRTRPYSRSDKQLSDVELSWWSAIGVLHSHPGRGTSPGARQRNDCRISSAGLYYLGMITVLHNDSFYSNLELGYSIVDTAHSRIRATELDDAGPGFAQIVTGKQITSNGLNAGTCTMVNNHRGCRIASLESKRVAVLYSLEHCVVGCKYERGHQS
jgi:hypothetical protein